MANPPQVRPWLRLASIRSNPTPAPAPSQAQTQAQAQAQDTRTAMGLPTLRTASAPSSPQSHPTQPPQEHNSSQPHKVSSSLPTSPLQKPTTLTSSPPPRVPSPNNNNHSPKTIKQNDHKHTSPPPSPDPLTLPPSQLRPEPKIPEQAEPKTVVVQKTIKPTSHNGKNHHHHHDESKEKGLHRKVSDSEDSAMRVITIAGENRGAFMELIQSPKKQEPKYLHKKGTMSSNVNVDGVESEGSNAEEGKKKDKNQKGRSASSFPMAAYMNSNVQCVNNSLLYHTSCSHHDPGVRLSLSKKPFGEGFHIKEHVDGHHP